MKISQPFMFGHWKTIGSGPTESRESLARKNPTTHHSGRIKAVDRHGAATIMRSYNHPMPCLDEPLDVIFMLSMGQGLWLKSINSKLLVGILHQIVFLLAGSSPHIPYSRIWFYTHH